MTVAIKRTYKATFILDTRGREESIEQLIEKIQTEIAGLGVAVSGAENLGRRDFARQADKHVVAGNYAQYMLEGDAETPAKIKELFRLNKLVYRVLLQNV
jgi:small subunit ribosomal protein S6